MEYISVNDFSKRFSLSVRRVQKLCETNRIEGAKMSNNVWLIPDTARKPNDNRKRMLPANSNYISLKDLCKLLSISEATGKNWVKLNKIEPQLTIANNYFFTQEYFDKIKDNISANIISSLKTRRNKKFVSGYTLYSSYVNEQSKNISIIENLINELTNAHITLTEVAQRALLTECAIQLFISKETNTFAPNNVLKAFLDGKLEILKYKSLITDLIYDTEATYKFIEEYPSLFKIQYLYEGENDILGLLYISSQNISSRKATGSYYTPNKIVTKLLDKLFSGNCELNEKTVLDPCCGTGNFLLQLPTDFKIENIYGNDIDSISTKLTRINLALKYSPEHCQILYNNITSLDYLIDDNFLKVDYIIGNPPWGYDYNDCQKDTLSSKYVCTANNSFESYDIFVEKSISHLKFGGILSYILPEAILNVKTHMPIREEIIKSNAISYISFLGNVFDKVNCPCIILQLKNTGIKFNGVGITVENSKREFYLSEPRVIDKECFNFNTTDIEQRILSKLLTNPTNKYLKNNSIFALGIVTGDNRKYISSTKEEFNEPVLKGMDIYKYKLTRGKNYITFNPKLFQQVASEQYYRAEEKLLYRFISSQLVFTYDNKQTLSLNSCNILIPKVDNLQTKYVLGILNSRIAQFVFEKQFNSVKVLRSHIEQIPLPNATLKNQQEVIDIVDLLLVEQDRKRILVLYNKLDTIISKLFSLSNEEYKIIIDSLSGENIFLY